jgi:hypothetical protein
MAKWWLGELRTGTLAYTDAINGIRKYLREGGLTLAQIGSSEAELEAGRVRGCKIYATYLLKALRRGTIMYKTYVYGLKLCLESARLRPEDVGSSEEEIASFEWVSEAMFLSWVKRPIPRREPAYP